VSIARWLLVAAVLACAASAARGLSAAASPSATCAPAPTVPGVTEGRSLPGTVAPSVGTLRAALLLVHPADAAPDASTSPPGKVIDGAAAWFEAVSYGRLRLRVETPPRWLALPERAAEYVAEPGRYLRDAVAAADPHVDFSQIDVVYLAPSSATSETQTSAILNGFGVRADGREIRLWIPFPAGFSTAPGDPYLLLHETGHLLGLPDLYLAGVGSSFHRWDLMAARWPAELLAWHRWKLGWLDAGQIVCVTGRATRTATLGPLDRPGGRKAIFVKRGSRVLAVEVRAQAGYDETMCEFGVLVYEVDQTPFRRAPIRIHVAQSDRSPPARGCAAKWNAPFGVGRGERRTLRLAGVRVDVLGRRSDGSYRVRVRAS
jgi:M6 family metalloprotease-like protein